jgi:hypothetical protein
MSDGRRVRLLVAGLAIAMLAAAGVAAISSLDTAPARAGGAAAAEVTAPTGASGATGAGSTSNPTGATGAGSTAKDSSGSKSSGSKPGSAWLIVFFLVLLLVAVGIPFIWDLRKSNQRKDEVLRLLKDPNSREILSPGDRAIAVDKLTSGTDGLTRGLLAFSLVGLFAAAILYLLIRDPAISHTQIVGNALAALITLVTSVVAFYFGSRAAQGAAGAGAGQGAGQQNDHDETG